MSSYRLFSWQADKLRRAQCPAAAILRCAVERWRRGDIVAQFGNRDEKGQNVLQLVSIRTRFAGVDDRLMRGILAAHYAHPVNFDREIAAQDELIAALMGGFRGAVALDSNGVPMPMQEVK